MPSWARRRRNGASARRECDRREREAARRLALGALRRTSVGHPPASTSGGARGLGDAARRPPRGRGRRRPPSRRRRAVAPAAATLPTVSASMPPSTSIRAAAPACRSRATLSGEEAMKGWPPQPGLTVMQRTTSAASPSSATASTRVPGLSAIPARQPRLADRGEGAVGVRRRLGVEGDASRRRRVRTPRSGARGARSSGGRRARRPPNGPGRRSSRRPAARS